MQYIGQVVLLRHTDLPIQVCIIAGATLFYLSPLKFFFFFLQIKFGCIVCFFSFV